VQPTPTVLVACYTIGRNVTFAASSFPKQSNATVAYYRLCIGLEGEEEKFLLHPAYLTVL